MKLTKKFNSSNEILSRRKTVNRERVCHFFFFYLERYKKSTISHSSSPDNIVSVLVEDMTMSMMSELYQSVLRVVFLLFAKVLYLPFQLYHFFIDSYALLSNVTRKEPDNVGEESSSDDDVSVDRLAQSEPVTDAILDAVDIVDICHAHGYKVHEHVVQTKDGYLLAIHRILAKSSDIHKEGRPVVYFHHGLLTNSELFVLGETPAKCLPYLLLEKGYDVWLGNNRGNKYSRKHLSLSSSSEKFWDYSLDEFALYDIPDTIDYILSTTNNLQLTYVGFSQGSAQAFGALSLNPKLNKKIKLFIGLSPAMIPKGLNHPIARLFVETAPQLVFSIFGRRAILPSVVFWQKLLGRLYYKTVVDKSLVLLFGWTSSNITHNQKAIGYPHLFSPSSVKSVVHWFQIINNKRFQMYDEGLVSPLTKITSTNLKVHRVAPFPVQTISAPIYLIYGKNDMLIDINPTRAALTSCKEIEAIGIDTYEHMDVLWARDVEEKVFKPVIDKIDKYNKQNQTMEIVECVEHKKINGTVETYVNKEDISEGSVFV
ncbi:unnamed protein product [Wickerhamomyces anomalus]